MGLFDDVGGNVAQLMPTSKQECKRDTEAEIKELRVRLNATVNLKDALLAYRKVAYVDRNSKTSFGALVGAAFLEIFDLENGIAELIRYQEKESA